MIKIQINNLPQKKQEYLDAVTDAVAVRVSILKKSLSHLNGTAVDFNPPGIARFRPITINIINLVGDKINIPNGHIGYTNSINNYCANANHLGNININGILQFCTDLLAINNQELSNLLTCDADKLLVLNNQILNNYGINTQVNIKILKLAFNYSIEDIAGPIKKYFKSNKFITFCPYCNMERAYHHTNVAGRVVWNFELDHFYDKARYPLLSYCIFNLVPSDHTCNTTNKGSIEFTDTYHMNPHHMGYADRVKFVPIGITTSYVVTKVEVQISEPQGSALYRQINGNNQSNDESGNWGNLNVFLIRTKYEDETYRAKEILIKINKENRNFRHIKKYLNALNILDRQSNYIKWYEKELNVRFKPTEFNEKSYSKYSRDIHDHYYSHPDNKTRLNKYIVDLINNTQ